MNEFQTGAVRDTGGKGRMDLLPWCALIRISKHMENAVAPDPKTGKSHYPERNWEKGIPMHSMVDSAFRHLAKYVDGWTDEDHLCAAATNLLMALWMEEKMPQMQDIPSRISSPNEVNTHTATSCNHEGDGLSSFDQHGHDPPYWRDKLPKRTCFCYVSNTIPPRCLGTSDLKLCKCEGDTSNCDFFIEFRRKSIE